MNIRWWQQRLYRDPATREPHQRFLRVLERYIRPTDRALDLGAGTGRRNPYALKGRVARIVGVDLCPEVVDNPLLDEGIQADVRNLPFPDASFDLVFSIYVLEHIREPQRLVREVSRILRPGGHFLALTPNRYHYVSLIAALTPTGFHKWFNRLRGRNPEDTFPTCYRMNTRGALARQFGRAGFEVVELSTIEVQPNYLTFSTPTFLLGAAYERLVNATELLAGLRVNIIGVMRKS